MNEAPFDGDKRWEELFADPRSPRLLEQLATEAMLEIEAGKTVDMDEWLETEIEC